MAIRAAIGAGRGRIDSRSPTFWAGAFLASLFLQALQSVSPSRGSSSEASPLSRVRSIMGIDRDFQRAMRIATLEVHEFLS